MRIALVHPYSWPEVRRGGERYLDDLARYLAAAGHDVEVLTGSSAVSSAEEIDVDAGRLVVRRLRHVRSRRLEARGLTPAESFGLLALPQLVRRRFDVVHALTPTAALAARASGHPTLYTLLGHPHREGALARPVHTRTVRLAVRAATLAAALSQTSADACRALLGHDAIVLPPGVRFDRFAPNLDRRDGPPRILLSADASDPRKGVHRLLAAFGLLLQRRADARLQISSASDWRWALERLPAPDRPRVEAAVDTLGAGALDEVPARYRAASITVLPSRAEAFGMVLVESLASGTPVVANGDGGAAEIVSDPAVGRVADADDPEALCAAMLDALDLAAQDDTARRCVDHARRWDWSVVGPAHEDVYARVAYAKRGVAR